MHYPLLTPTHGPRYRGFGWRRGISWQRQKNRPGDGRNGGLGEAICRKLAALGYTVVTTYSPGNTKALQWLAAMKEEGFDFHAYPATWLIGRLAMRALARVVEELVRWMSW